MKHKLTKLYYHVYRMLLLTLGFIFVYLGMRYMCWFCWCVGLKNMEVFLWILFGSSIIRRLFNIHEWSWCCMRIQGRCWQKVIMRCFFTKCSWRGLTSASICINGCWLCGYWGQNFNLNIFPDKVVFMKIVMSPQWLWTPNNVYIYLKVTKTNLPKTYKSYFEYTYFQNIHMFKKYLHVFRFLILFNISFWSCVRWINLQNVGCQTVGCYRWNWFSWA